ncbi:hypothetical protein [Tolypothrix sp. VBCCA 56010]|uniref:hypothetical protein n=1 Tax=Tolypothrix sp. VBCCA 56010 TaxID=3137731 RepID=UPI003D7DB7DF
MGHGGGSTLDGFPGLKHLPSWGMRHGKHLLLPMPIAQCPMPNNQQPKGLL